MYFQSHVLNPFHIKCLALEWLLRKFSSFHFIVECTMSKKAFHWFEFFIWIHLLILQNNYRIIQLVILKAYSHEASPKFIQTSVNINLSHQKQTIFHLTQCVTKIIQSRTFINHTYQRSEKSKKRKNRKKIRNI